MLSSLSLNNGDISLPQAIYSLVGSHESVNPRKFRVLVSDGSVPTEFETDRSKPLSEVGLPSFCVLIGENRIVSVQ